MHLWQQIIVKHGKTPWHILSPERIMKSTLDTCDSVRVTVTTLSVWRFTAGTHDLILFLFYRYNIKEIALQTALYL